MVTTGALFVFDGWLMPAQAGRQLGIGPERVRQLIAEGRLRAVRTAAGRLVDPASVEELKTQRAAMAAAR